MINTRQLQAQALESAWGSKDLPRKANPGPFGRVDFP